MPKCPINTKLYQTCREFNSEKNCTKKVNRNQNTHLIISTFIANKTDQNSVEKYYFK